MPKKTTRRGLHPVRRTNLRKADLRRAELGWVQKLIDLQDIDPSPYQGCRYFDEDKLKELAAMIEASGSLRPIEPLASPSCRLYEPKAYRPEARNDEKNRTF